MLPPIEPLKHTFRSPNTKTKHLGPTRHSGLTHFKASITSDLWFLEISTDNFIRNKKQERSRGCQNPVLLTCFIQTLNKENLKVFFSVNLQCSIYCKSSHFIGWQDHQIHTLMMTQAKIGSNWPSVYQEGVFNFFLTKTDLMCWFTKKKY